MNKTLVIVICALGGLGAIVASGVGGFLIGRRYERQNMLDHPRQVEEQIRGMMKNPNVPPAVKNHLPGLGSAIKGLRGNSIAGEITEVNSEENIVVIDDLARGESWEILVSENTIYRKDFEEESSLDDLMVGDNLMVIGKKNAEEFSIEADEIIILIAPQP